MSSRKRTTRSGSKKKAARLPLEDVSNVDESLELCDGLNKLSVKDKPQKKVNFGGDREAVYDREEAPVWVGIGSTMNSKKKQIVSEDKPGSEVIVAEEEEVIQEFSIHKLDQEVSQTWDTKLLSVTELKSELLERRASTSGTKEELRIRLDRLLIKEGLAASPGTLATCSKKKKAIKVDTILQDLRESIENCPDIHFLMPTNPPPSDRVIRSYGRKSTVA
ncbi:hypothetical protein PROFUN_07953 [Planoprotostelium fungivorum]|uniref:SAP domain-containing protein n=1 Tax=Planoprotostelium fungivorum TaxID=1890364 RepID=A0A2P6NL76_9EUKA|nr:hypothetical protein PROFUN_07953 [Planoprotostelium fungivorum]